jgi:hypothetical protein|tara:strand:- start:375 stop:605 length:231 start_codon:yes stop_codon:yes gene_type:complete
MIVNQTISKVEGLRVRLCKWDDQESLFIIFITPDGEVETLLHGKDNKLSKEVLKHFDMSQVEIADYRGHKLYTGEG